MAIYQIDQNRIVQIQQTTFAERGLKERSDLQRLLRNQIEIISPDTIVVGEEFGEWEDSRRRIDLLGIDKAANIVVIELKRTEDGGHMELQAVRYAAMVSALTFDRVVEIFRKYMDDNSINGNPKEKILDFLEWEEPDEDQFGQDVRIVLASAEFSKELTTSVMWLNERNLDIRCVRLKPYMDGDRTLLDVQTVIPLPEAEAYQVQLREKQQKERQSRKSNRDFTRYDLTISGELIPNLPKRGLMFHTIKHIIDSGVKPEDVADAIPWRKKNLFVEFDGELDEEEIMSRLSENSRYRRFFSKDDELFHVDGRTYLLSNQWGLKTFEAAELLKARFQQIEIDVKPVAKQ